MNVVAQITRKLGLGAISVLSATATIGKIVVSNLGDVQAVSAAAGTFGPLVLFLNSVPMWFVVGTCITTTAYLIGSAVQEDLRIARLIADAKASNEQASADVKKMNTRAWEFAPEFRAEMDKLAADREAFLAAVAEIGRLQTTYHNSMADAVDEVSRRYDERAERAVRDVFGRHFENMRIERKFEDEKQMREERRSLQIMVAREVGAVTARLDALPQSPQGTGPEAPR